MASGQLIVACDFGTTTFRTLVGEVGPGGELALLGAGAVPSAGYRDGDFVDLRAGSHHIGRAVSAAEAAADVDIAAFYCNVSGSHLRSLTARGQVQVGPVPRAISDADVDGALAKARSIIIPFDQCILAANPVDFAVDRVRGIVDPRGRIGTQLEVEAHLVTGSGSVVRNVDRAVRMAGYEVAGRAVDVLAAAECLLDPQEREEGVLLIDVGGRTTGWALFRGGRIAGSGAVPWGGWHMTSDLAHGLRITHGEAEQVKVRRGIALRSLVEGTDFEALFEEEHPEETPGLVAAILEPRLEEIFALVKRDAGGGAAAAALGRGIVLTGGGCRCRGSALLCEEVFGAQARCRFLPERLAGVERLGEGQWATALGLVLWAAGTARETAPAAAGVVAEGGQIWRRVRGWFARSPAAGRQPIAET